jgi:UDP-N-acetylmuramate dehydrogenase
VFLPEVSAGVLQPALQGRTKRAEDEDFVWLEAGAGENWHEFVRWTLQQGWPGLENLSLIPGTVGAAPIQNIGAYGAELENFVDGVEAVDIHTGAVRQYQREDCAFAYRDSIFKHAHRDCVITKVIFKLPKRWKPCLAYQELVHELEQHGDPHSMTPLQISDAVIDLRTRKLPDWRKLGNVGSFFKNPLVSAQFYQDLLQRYPKLPAYPQAQGQVKLAAGWLIEQAGWKGRRLGAVGVYEKQALVLVNHGAANGRELLSLAHAVASSVKQQFGIELEQEPVVIPKVE